MPSRKKMPSTPEMFSQVAETGLLPDGTLNCFTLEWRFPAMEQTANALPPVTLGQYKGLPVTRRVRPVTEKAVELEKPCRRPRPFLRHQRPRGPGDAGHAGF